MELATPTKDETSRLAQPGARPIHSGATPPILDLITHIAARLFGAPIALISSPDKTQPWMTSCVGLDIALTPREISLCSHTDHRPDDPLVIPDARNDPRFRDDPLVAVEGGIVFYAGQPLRGPDGSALGALCVMDRAPRQWTARDQEALAGLARWAEAEIALHAAGLHDLQGLGPVGAGDTTPVQRARFWHLSQDVFCLADAEGRLLDHNDRLAGLLGYPSKAMRGRSLIDIVHPDDRARTSRFLVERSWNEGAKSFVNRLRRAGGAYIALEWTVAAEGPITYAVARDVTQREQAIRALESMNIALAASNQDLRRFASFTAHELRSPVRAMANSAALLQRKLAGGDEGDIGWAVTLAGAARRMDELIQSMLTLASVNTDDTPHSRIGAGTIIAETMAAIEKATPEAQVHWPMFEPVYGNPKQIHELFMRLVENAIKYHAIDVLPIVDITASPRNDRIVFEVTDNGIGFPPGQEDAIFEPLRRLHSRDRYSGTGMGLALCRKIVERHDGTIVARSEPGGGATFTFDLPAAVAHRAETARPSPPRVRP